MNWTLVEWLFYDQGYQGRTTQSLIRGVEKWSSQEATLLGGAPEKEEYITGLEILPKE